MGKIQFTATLILLTLFFVFIIFSGRLVSLGKRLSAYKFTIESWLDKPFFGHGVSRKTTDVFSELEEGYDFPRIRTENDAPGIKLFTKKYDSYKTYIKRKPNKVELINLGTHSQYLAILYQQGIIGLLAYLSIIIFIWRRLNKIRGSPGYDPYLYKLAGFAGWGFIATAFQGLYNSLYVDSISWGIVWLNWGLILALDDVNKQGELK